MYKKSARCFINGRNFTIIKNAMPVDFGRAQNLSYKIIPLAENQEILPFLFRKIRLFPIDQV